MRPLARDSGPQYPTLAVTHQQPGGRIAEVTADDQGFGAAEPLDEGLACEGTLGFVHVEVTMPQRIAQLDRVVHDIPRNDRFLATRPDEDTDMPGRVTRRRE